MISLMWSLEKQTNKINSHGYREQIGSCQKGSGLGGGQKGVKGGQLHNDG